jgi:hypothetical protein
MCLRTFRRCTGYKITSCAIINITGGTHNYDELMASFNRYVPSVTCQDSSKLQANAVTTWSASASATQATHFADDVNNTFDDIRTALEEQGIASSTRDSCSTRTALVTAYSGSDSEASDGGSDKGSGNEEGYGCSNNSNSNSK